ncbi:hypothetical protein THAOC_26173 [Thalassiosira oceanica]|uniref:RING-type domain-containing protein n=1 Tax=Thalassiosira oceanica TaxID=159749 RepID=K0S5U7_THAOC|nr:hypothetical protein THAOC_26173 [Thalassiosira oceanica]|eukprot:EJK54227.1 hypothetical protein THAOC_26173 [Thalassiosira oceanica]
MEQKIEAQCNQWGVEYEPPSEDEDRLQRKNRRLRLTRAIKQRKNPAAHEAKLADRRLDRESERRAGGAAVVTETEAAVQGMRAVVLLDGPQGTQARADHGSGDSEEPPPHPTNAADDGGCTDGVAGEGGAGAADDGKDPQPLAKVDDDDVGCEAAEGEADSDEICGICLDVYDNPVQLPCGHSFCEVCLDGWHKKSKYNVHQPRNCPLCRRTAKPSPEIMTQLYTLTLIVKTVEAGYDLEGDIDDLEKMRIKRDELLAALFKMGYTREEVNVMLKEYSAQQNSLPFSIMTAAGKNDAQTILDWLGSPVDESKLDVKYTGITMVHYTALHGHVDLTSLLLQHGAAVNVYDANGATPILHPLWEGNGLVNETVAMLYEWGASLEHHVQGENGARVDATLATTPMFQDEFVKRRCEIVNLNQRKDLIGQTCIVEKYIAKKDRYKVTTEHARETFLVGRDNLRRRDRTPDDPGYYVTFEDGEYKRHTFTSNKECQEFVRSRRTSQE